jgi:hypothetical protein
VKKNLNFNIFDPKMVEIYCCLKIQSTPVITSYVGIGRKVRYKGEYVILLINYKILFTVGENFEVRYIASMLQWDSTVHSTIYYYSTGEFGEMFQQNLLVRHETFEVFQKSHFPNVVKVFFKLANSHTFKIF